MRIHDGIKSGRTRRLCYFFTLFAVIWSTSFGIAYAVIAFYINNQVNNETHNYANSLIQKLDALLDGGEEALDELNQLSITDCSPELIDQVKLLHFRHYLIQNATILMRDEQGICSSMKGASKDSLQTTPSHLRLNHTRYWFQQTITGTASSEHHTVMEKGNARINIHLQLLLAPYVIEHPNIVIQFLSQSRVIASSDSVKKRSLLKSGGDWRSQLTGSLKRPPFSVIVAQNERHIQKTVITAFTKSLGWIGLLASSLCFFVYFFIRQYSNSFKFALIRGIEREEFVPHFQPIIDTKSGWCVGAEVLTRWNCRDGSVILPGLFIPAAEQCGLMPVLTRYVIARAFNYIGVFLSEHPQYYISINLSLDDLEDDGIYALLTQEKARYGLVSGQLRIELTERQFISKGHAVSVLHRYREAGCQIYIDDFGTGYSSLAYLTDLPIDTLKIDKVFIDSLGHKSATSSVTRHIIEMANTLNLELIAEGVETEEQRRILQSLGVYIVQGWLYSKALPASEWILFCENHST